MEDYSSGALAASFPGELLEIMGSIINGFAVPLKEEHKDLCDGEGRRGRCPERQMSTSVT